MLIKIYQKSQFHQTQTTSLFRSMDPLIRLKCIGIGTDAAVFQSIDHPAYAFKMYADDKVEKIQIERRVYEILGDSPYFSTCFGY